MQFHEIQRAAIESLFIKPNEQILDEDALPGYTPEEIEEMITDLYNRTHNKAPE